MKRKILVLPTAIALIALGMQPVQANSVHDSDNGAFYAACASYFWAQDWGNFQSCAIGFWYGRLAYNAGQADSAYSLINSPGWPIACPQGPESENPLCAATYNQYELYSEATELAGEDYNYWLSWTPPG